MEIGEGREREKVLNDVDRASRSRTPREVAFPEALPYVRARI
jgi:hypothetical protein